jgi:hypothetical protein
MSDGETAVVSIVAGSSSAFIVHLGETWTIQV